MSGAIDMSTDKSSSESALDPAVAREMYVRMLRIRMFEEQATQLSADGLLPGSIHTSMGQEASTVGACMALRRDDYMIGNHRSHGHPLGKGAEPSGLMAELLGRIGGVNRGKGGSMHLADFSVGSLGETSIVGSGLPVAAGAALGLKMQGKDGVCLCFFGDGASNEGAFHEALNLAAVWQLPVVYVCENNGYGATTPARDVVAVKDVSARAQAYDIPGVIVDGQDVAAVYRTVLAAVERARAGEGPSIVETKTYRYANHAVGLQVENYREKSEIEEWRLRDPLIQFRSYLIDNKIFESADIDAMEAEVTRHIADAVDYAKASPFPEPAEAFDFNFVDAAGGSAAVDPGASAGTGR